VRLIKLHYLVNVETGRVNMSDDPFSTIRPPIGRMEPDQILCDAVDWADVMLEYECLELPEVNWYDASIVHLEEELEVADHNARTFTCCDQRCTVDATPPEKYAFRPLCILPRTRRRDLQLENLSIGDFLQL
jgi:hypothetical protein